MYDLGELGQLNGTAEQKIQQLWQQLEALRDEMEDELRSIKRAAEEQAGSIAGQEGEIQALTERVAALEAE